MDEFKLQIDPYKFRKTNEAWNLLCLNDPWSVGYVSFLIETETFLDKHDWENFYYESGHERNRLIQNLTQQKQTLLNLHTLKKTDPEQIERLDRNLKNLNFRYGRTKEQFVEKGEILYNFIKDKANEITRDECIESVRYRTICETWNGIIIRERNTIKKLRTLLPSLEFVKTSAPFDHRFAVDYELKFHGKLICGIQIKPPSYIISKSSFIQKARSANTRKNQKYSDSFHKNVYYIVSKMNGDVENSAVVDEIKLLIPETSTIQK